MAILGCISLVVMYLLLRKISNKKIAIIGLTFFAICPWHIMKSRWGLESNLFPDLILIFTYLLIKGLEDNNKILYYLSFVIAGISAYAYGTSYYFLPAFLIPLLIILVKKQKVNIKQAIISIAIVGIISMPIILYVIINTLNLEQINLPFVTIPKLEVNRYKELTTMFSGDFLKSTTSNLISSLRILVTQYDGLKWNSILPTGTIYIFSIIFTIIGIIDSFKKKRKLDIKYSFIFNIMFIASIILAIICEPNINRLNIIMIPIIYYTIVGIYLVIKDRKRVAVSIAILYVISFALFITCYLKEDCDEYGTFASDLKEVVEYVDNLEGKQIVIDQNVNYIYVLFYSNYNTRDFVDTVEYENKYVEFRKVNSFGKYNFDKISNFNDDYVYVIKKSDKDLYALDDYKIKEFKKYVVIEK